MVRRTKEHSTTIAFPLVGPSGEKIDLWRTLVSHGMTSLPPMSVDEDARTMDLTLALDGRLPRRIRIEQGKPGYGRIEVFGRAPGRKTEAMIRTKVRHILRLDEDLSEFYRLIADDPDLAWAREGAGRMIQGASVFEDVIKTVCTTNCAWSATERMVAALCEHLGDAAQGAPAASPQGRVFPSPRAMAEAGEPFYRDIARAGYRGPYLIEIAEAVHSGSLDLEALGKASPDELSDDDLEEHLLDLPGVGPYAAAHIMFTIGRYSRIILDSWTRPKYAALVGREKVKDSTIEKRFRRYGRYAGLAFWMFLTRDWVDEPAAD
jgi:3-methyladenine DNA glycosylase/8-oxoguanine DNA glycosylase